MKSTLLVRPILTALGAILLFCSPNLSAQQPSQQEPPPKQESSSKQRDPDAPDTYKPQPKKIPPSEQRRLHSIRCARRRTLKSAATTCAKATSTRRSTASSMPRRSGQTMLC